jgi:hypothetical protein
LALEKPTITSFLDIGRDIAHPIARIGSFRVKLFFQRRTLIRLGFSKTSTYRQGKLLDEKLLFIIPAKPRIAGKRVGRKICVTIPLQAASQSESIRWHQLEPALCPRSMAPVLS